MTKEARELKQDYIKQAGEQWKGEPISEDIGLGIDLYFGDKRKRDWDNFHKISQDSLEGIVFENDNQIQWAFVRKFISKDNPRIEITIYEM